MSMYEEKTEKLVNIEPKNLTPPKRRKGRPAYTEEQKQAVRVSKGLAPVKDSVALTKGRRKAVEKARLVKALKAEYRHETDPKKLGELEIQINALAVNKVVPKANADLKKKIQYQNPAYKEEGLEDYSLDHNPQLLNVEQPQLASGLNEWSDSKMGQSLWSSKLTELETKMNNLDNYLSKIRVLSGEGSAADYANPQNVKQNHYIQPHNNHITPHHGATDPSPFVSIPFRGKVVRR